MRVHFIVDGFNLYHSVKAAERRRPGPKLRWLDQHALCLTLVRSVFGRGARLEGVHYFSALATHLITRKPDVVARHELYIRALEGSGVIVSLGTFKSKDRIDALSQYQFRVHRKLPWWRIPINCVRVKYRSHEEKETDVAIACKLLDLLHGGHCDTAVLVSGDTDLAPAITTARRLFPAVGVCVAFPFERHNADLKRIASRTIKLTPALYGSHQFPVRVQDRHGAWVEKPATW